MKFLFSQIILLVFVSSALCQEATLEDVKKSLSEFNYRQVIDLSDQILTGSDTLSEDLLVKIFSMKAVAYYSLGQTSDARRSFIDILKINDDYKPDPAEISPKIIGFFNDVKQEYLSIIEKQKIEEPANVDSIQISEPVILRVEKNVMTNALGRSILFPGMGHLYLSNNAKGWILTSLNTAALGSMLYFIFDSRNKELDYLEQTEPALINEKYDKYNTSYKIRNTLIITYAVIWIYSQIDLLFFSDDEISNKINTILLTDYFTPGSPRIQLSIKFEL